MRGGSFVDDAFFLRGSNRSNDFYEGYEYVTVGFRVVWSAEERFR
jgi:formylglycine-generating enzyme required for sulfatase activity